MFLEIPWLFENESEKLRWKTVAEVQGEILRSFIIDLINSSEIVSEWLLFETFYH